MLAGVLIIAAAQTAVAAAPQEQRRGDEIFVTGERVKRSLRDTASSVSVVSQRDIEAASADRVKQMLELVPNVQLGNGSQGPAIRGQDTTGALQALPAFLGGNRPRTSLVVDGRRITYSEFVFGAAPAWDLNRIEVFRSPQTTTQGVNSIAGAIFVTSNDPTFEPETRARLIAGNYHTGEVSALASGPLGGDVALRLSGDLRYSRTTSRIADRIAGGDPNHDVYGLARAKLLVKPRGLGDTRLLVTYTHTQSQAPQIVGLTVPFEKRRDESGFYGTFRINVDALTAALHHGIAPSLVVDLTLTGGDSRARRLAFPGFGQTSTKGRDWSVEGVVNWKPNGPLSAVGGVSGTHLKLRQFINLSLLSGTLGRFGDVQDSIGLFGEASLTLLPRTTLTGGLRYQQDRQKRSGELTANFGSVPLAFDRTFHAWLPKLSIAYDVSPAVRAGVLVQRAYNPGGTTLRFDIGRPDNFEAERLWDYELFVRGTLARGLSLSSNLFYYDMRDAQRLKEIVVLTPDGRPVGFADLFNAPRAHSYGAEAELSWQARTRLRARLSGGFLRTKLVDPGPDYPGFKGNEFARAPHFTVAGAVDWDATPKLHLSGQGRYRSRYFADDVNSTDVRVPAAMIVDVRAEYRLGRVTAFAYARNLFDRFALIDRNDDELASAEDPRMVGVGIEARF
jgi:outer membrane receptor protein involved in Fe transport